MGRPSKLRIIPRPHPANASAPKRSAGDGATPMLRQLRTKFIALNMALAALVLAASFATICYADYRADIDDVRNRLMAADLCTNRSSSLMPSRSTGARALGKETKAPQMAPARRMKTPALTTGRAAAQTQATARKTRARPPKAAATPQPKPTTVPPRAARPPPPPRTSAPARVIPASRRPASAARAPPRRHRCPWRSTISPTARLCS